MLLFNYVSTSDLPKPMNHTLNNLINVVVVGVLVAEQDKIRRVREEL